MFAPWNVRVSPVTLCTAKYLVQSPDYFKVEVRIKGKWFDAGTGKTWFEAFLMGLAA